MDGFYAYLLFCIALSGSFMFLLLKMPMKDCLAIECDSQLLLYKFEMKNHRNDGWIMQYYREKYKERLEFLLEEKKVKKIWWNIYSAFEKV